MNTTSRFISYSKDKSLHLSAPTHNEEHRKVSVKTRLGKEILRAQHARIPVPTQSQLLQRKTLASNRIALGSVETVMYPEFSGVRLFYFGH